ncbi:acyl-protein synthetase [Candidatus Methylacidiphilum infernorum]|uniref:Acyl-protein synthetase n=1 Tax=Candidatus Methylacidiphilum infernorum TaxID=511746 RepID=A0ABX7PSR8_9BACT|nr:acyl-protein synthetase [Candidatus Methylacidiphilum infernorum]QSR86017.1 acyl-protein synthetase [Candidatus Methylacidiphilum infernorum]
MKEKAKELQRSFFQDPINRQWWMDQIISLIENPHRFNSLALFLFEFQKNHCPPYKIFCQSFPQYISCWRDIPALPQELFKKATVFCHEIEKAAVFYLTSGTTSGVRGKHYLWDNAIYKTVSWLGALQAAVPIDSVHLHFLAPSPKEEPRSSLSAMFSFWAEKNPFPSYFWIENKTFSIEPFRKKLTADILENKKLGICGTAFSFAYLMENQPNDPLPLPQGSFILETGGMKGKSKEIDKKEFYQRLSSYFGLPQDRIFSEYGMTELSSQAYSRGYDGEFHTPPWARILVIDPRTDKECQVGQKGLIRWIDLANIDSILCIQTGDVAIKTPESFFLLGRSRAASPRGCSLSVEEMLSI